MVLSFYFYYSIAYSNRKPMNYIRINVRRQCCGSSGEVEGQVRRTAELALEGLQNANI